MLLAYKFIQEHATYFLVFETRGWKPTLLNNILGTFGHGPEDRLQFLEGLKRRDITNIIAL